MSVVLETSQLDKRFGGIHVTNGISLQLRAGERVGLIGPNGAGKTTLVNLISGVLRPSSGQIHLAGNDVTTMSQAGRVRRGLVLTFQLTTLAPHLPVQRQVELALFEREGLTWRAWRCIDDFPNLSLEAAQLLRQFGWSRTRHAPPSRWPMASSGSWKWCWPLRFALVCCCWTNRWREFRRAKAHGC